MVQEKKKETNKKTYEEVESAVFILNFRTHGSTVLYEELRC